MCSSQASDDHEITEPEKEASLEGWAHAICALVVSSPVILFVGVIRWNIKDQLDDDLAAILTWFCDTVLFFLFFFPAAIATKSKIIRLLFQKSVSGLATLLGVAAIFFVIVFAVIAVMGFWELFKFVMDAMR